MTKGLVYLSVFIFSTIGSYIPVLFHQSFFSWSSILGGVVGTVFGVWIVVKYRDYF